ncbi:MAG TPA: hypothetical protein EYP93_08875, partial [Gammaproteobacteria bacterium]|nr:hypothetical protein [Gammaproteobacteria bacterium]
MHGSVTGTHALGATHCRRTRWKSWSSDSALTLGATIRNTETRSLVATEAHIARIGDFEEDLTAVCFQLFDETLALSDPYHQRMIVSTKTERCYRIAAVFLNVVRDRMACMSVERIDIAALHSLREYEDAEFVRRRPRSRELLERGRASMPGGVPMSWMT